MQLDPEQEPQRTVHLSTLEKSVATALGTFVVAILGWIAWTTNDTAKAISVLQTRLEYIQTDAKDALQLRKDTETTIADHERRLIRLETVQGIPRPKEP